LEASLAGIVGSAAPRVITPVAVKTKRVLLVALAGGIRTRETLGTPANVPNLMRMAGDGVVYSRARASNLGHYGATLSILTGIAEPRGIRDNARGTDPTLFEYLRKDLGWSASDVWVSTSGGLQEANVSHSLHPEYGQAFGANTLDGDGVFNAEFKQILEAYGRPKDMEPRERQLLEEMRSSIGAERKGRKIEGEELARVERFLLDELSRGTQDLTGLGASDAKAFRVARNLLAVFRPRLLSVVARDADIAHGSFSNYVQIIRRNDAMLGELFDAVLADRELAETTSILVLPEFGRDADLNSRRGLDHGDGSDDLGQVALVCWGPDFRRGQGVQEEVRTIDVCATVCELLGAEPRYSRGKRLPRLMA
jgi:hypothetical protein